MQQQSQAPGGFNQKLGEDFAPGKLSFLVNLHPSLQLVFVLVAAASIDECIITLKCYFLCLNKCFL